MARLGSWELSQIKQQILTDLYEKSEQEFVQRQTKIVEQNRKYYFEPIQHLLDQLPAEMISMSNRYQIKICYLPIGTSTDENERHRTVVGIWGIELENRMPNPATLQQYNQVCPTENNLDPRLYPITAKLCNEMIIIQKEKHKLQEFLNTSMDQYSGTLQLRKIWPDYLHKYLPAEPTKQAKLNKQKAKALKAIAPAIPEFIKTRLTINLLEDN